MTEGQWLSDIEPYNLLGFIKPSASRRKLLLFCCACCRRHVDLLRDSAARQALDTYELVADGRCDYQERDAAWAAVRKIHLEMHALERKASRRQSKARRATERGSVQAQRWTRQADALSEQVERQRREQAIVEALCYLCATDLLFLDPYRFLARATSIAVDTPEERRVECDLLRDIFGNPFRVVQPTLFASWQLDDRVPALARAIYDERRFEDLPMLADALEEAGCTDAAILEHCRAGGDHVRGCWVVDGILGQG